MARGLSEEDKGRLLMWLKANELETARDLREDGWEEDARGLWSRGELRGLHLLDAADVMRETTQDEGKP